MGTTMRMVSAELDELVGVLRETPDADWDLPSACDGFRIRDVAAHLALVRKPLSRRLASALVKPADVLADLGGAWSVEYADELTPAELLEDLEARARHPRRGFLGRIDPAANMLADHATHLQDVRVGLDRRAPHDPDRARAVLGAAVRLWRPLTWGTRERAKGLRLVATDVDWSHGEGPEVSGPYDGMLLALSGRPAGLALLEGEGLGELGSRMPAATV